jgi:mutator protein MutT
MWGCKYLHPHILVFRGESSMLKIAVGIVWRGGQVLVAQRLDSAAQSPGKCEFPGGKHEEGESLEECARREILEETGLQVLVGQSYEPILWSYPEREVELHAFDCEVLEGEARALESKKVLWLWPRELECGQFPEANGALIQAIQKRHC